MRTLVTNFPTEYDAILDRLASIDPIDYGKSRNFIDGAVTYLSPYISRGVLSTRQVLESCLKRGYAPSRIQKFIQELAWRDYWQLLWIELGEEINNDIRALQSNVEYEGVPQALYSASTSIHAIDDALQNFYETGYLHNHVRMYIAAIACNIGHYHWCAPAKWMYYHLLDADWASNALSWQWVAGTNSHKKYIANQDNINRYCYTEQKDTFLDISYEELSQITTPEVLKQSLAFTLKTPLPALTTLSIDPELPTLLYNCYNLDPSWMNDIQANRILLLEPSVFQKYPVSSKTIDFILGLSKNIQTIQIYTGEFQQLLQEYSIKDVHFKEHPLNNYIGTAHPRDWMFSVKGRFPSFFAFWKKCEKELKNYAPH